MKTKLTKQEAGKEIEKFFKEINKKTGKEIKKIRRLAMSHSIKLGEKRKKFCKKCFSTKLKVKSIKRGIKTVECKKCGSLFRWQIKN